MLYLKTHKKNNSYFMNYCLLIIFTHLIISKPLLADMASSINNNAVNITATLPYVEVKHKEKIIQIKRNQNLSNMITPDFSLTSRPCPPYCIQPINLSPGVDTIGELEILNYLQKASNNESILVIDSREEKWLSKGMIPGAISIPWKKLYNKTTSDEEISEILQFHFNAVLTGKLWNFESAKTLVFYCNGPWCGQSPTNIRALLSIGYPAHKIKWYRGGMQSWETFGLTTVKP